MVLNKLNSGSKKTLPIVLILSAIGKGGLEPLRMEYKNTFSANQIVCAIVFAVSVVLLVRSVITALIPSCTFCTWKQPGMCNKQHKSRREQ